MKPFGWGLLLRGGDILPLPVRRSRHDRLLFLSFFLFSLSFFSFLSESDVSTSSGEERSLILSVGSTGVGRCTFFAYDSLVQSFRFVLHISTHVTCLGLVTVYYCDSYLNFEGTKRLWNVPVQFHFDGAVSRLDTGPAPRGVVGARHYFNEIAEYDVDGHVIGIQGKPEFLLGVAGSVPVALVLSPTNSLKSFVHKSHMSLTNVMWCMSVFSVVFSCIISLP